MIGDTLFPGKAVGKTDPFPISLEIDLTFEEKLNTAKSILKNTGLRFPLAPLILLCGHESSTSNNPYSASLDCGACGGHSGRANVLVAAEIFNDARVRNELGKSGVIIPNDTVFVPAVHDTTTDEVSVLFKTVTPELSENLSELKNWLSNATSINRRNRLPTLTRPATTDDSICIHRASDWSEVRPEWGLAKNGGFIAASRARTRLCSLGGRYFLHEYDFNRDPDLSILELILTAPVVVASWINLQYFASAMSPKFFGSGNKVIHNVVGQLGVLSGNGGDLQIGLPFQSVHTGTELYHDAIRLQVVIEAPEKAIREVIDKHILLNQLIGNEWMKVFSLKRESVEMQRVLP